MPTLRHLVCHMGLFKEAVFRLFISFTIIASCLHLILEGICRSLGEGRHIVSGLQEISYKGGCLLTVGTCLVPIII